MVSQADKPGEKVGLDGVIVSGQSAINQAPITGESVPVEKTVGDTVYAGTINESGSFEFEVTAAATNSILARIIHAVEEAQGARAHAAICGSVFQILYACRVSDSHSGGCDTAAFHGHGNLCINLYGAGHSGYWLTLRPGYFHTGHHRFRHGRCHPLRHLNQGRHVPGTRAAS